MASQPSKEMTVSEALRKAVQSHNGEFICSEINKPNNTKTVLFRHAIGKPRASASIPNVPGLVDFYQTFGSLTLFLDDASGESAFYIAKPTQWRALKADFMNWPGGMDNEDLSEFVPFSIADCIAVGEIPESGNYLLVAASGKKAGKVYKFDHDGFEFIEMGKSLSDFVKRALAPRSQDLTDMASHMRFIVKGSRRQWWIEEMRDSLGRVVRTKT